MQLKQIHEEIISERSSDDRELTTKIIYTEGLDAHGLYNRGVNQRVNETRNVFNSSRETGYSGKQQNDSTTPAQAVNDSDYTPFVDMTQPKNPKKVLHKKTTRRRLVLNPKQANLI